MRFDSLFCVIIHPLLLKLMPSSSSYWLLSNAGYWESRFSSQKSRISINYLSRFGIFIIFFRQELDSYHSLITSSRFLYSVIRRFWLVVSFVSSSKNSYNSISAYFLHNWSPFTPLSAVCTKFLCFLNSMNCLSSSSNRSLLEVEFMNSTCFPNISIKLLFIVWMYRSEDFG